MAEEQKLVFRVATPFLWWVIYEEGQRWTFLRIFNFLTFLLVSPLIILMVIVSQMFARPLDRSPDEVMGFLANEIEGRSEFRDWDDFISIPIADPELNAIRVHAAELGSPNEHRSELLELLERTRRIADQTTSERQAKASG